MSKHFDLRTALGLENNGIDVDINIGTTDSTSGDVLDDPMVSPVASSGAMTPEAAEVEVQESAIEAEAASEEIDEIDEDVSALESYAAVLERSLEHNGINVISAEMLNVGLDKILSKYNVTSNELVPALESYSSNSYATTKVSLETIKETAKNLKDGIKAALLKLWNAIMDFVRNIGVKLIPATKVRINMLAKFAKSKDSRGSNNGQAVKVSGKTAKLLVGKDKAAIIKDYSTFIDEMSATATDIASLSKAFENSLNDTSKLSAEVVTAANKLMSNGVFKNTKKESSGDTSFKVATALFGGGEHGVGFNPEKGYAEIAFNKDAEDKEAGEVELKGLDSNEVVTLCESLLKFLDHIAGASKELAKRGKITSFLEKFSKNKDENPDNANSWKASIKLMSDGFRNLSSHSLQVVNALIDYARLSVKGNTESGGNVPALPAPSK